MAQHLNIIGAGLTGSLLSIYLAKRGYSIDIYEKRSDMRLTKVEAGRSINLALSSRGLCALQEVGIAESVLEYAVKMPGRMLHAQDESLRYVPYGKNENEYINSISRSGLNIALLNLAEAFPNIRIHFNHTLEKVSLQTGQSWLRNRLNNEMVAIEAAATFGTDGAGSVIRNAMQAEMKDFSENSQLIAHGYKELNIPPNAQGEFQIAQNALHIWPRGEYMLIALPNLDASFTCTLFLPNEGSLSFESLKNEQIVRDFFQTQFPDTLKLIPTLVEDFLQNPLGTLGTIRCSPWNYQGKFVLLGDAAHAILPFYGQGMNASFEDCILLNNLIDTHEGEWEAIFSAFSTLRKPNADAIAKLAEENFYEMRDGTAKPEFLLARQLEGILENTYPDYHSKYSMVTFHPEIPYSEAHRLGNKQNNYLLSMCENRENIDHLVIEDVYTALRLLR